ncbi:hypothetical protein KKF34_10410 [Myxococcota bacterium]|nr:hypothetical protein [Myxococcota bacterium]MBU1380507.1 hypothetical protein [Myxococcota bacterium]MBU1497278.1 hypothetical protein [Myxococcota bacterium]
MKKLVFALLFIGCASTSGNNKEVQVVPDVIKADSKVSIYKPRRKMDFIKKIETMEIASLEDLTYAASNAGLSKSQAFDYILESLNSSDTSEVEKSLKIISKMGDYKLDLLIESLENGNKNWRVISLIGTMGSSAHKALPVLRKVWFSGNTEVKIAVLNAVSRISRFEGEEIAFLSASSNDIDVALMGVSSLEEKVISSLTIMNYARILRMGDSYQRCSIIILFGNSIKNVKRHPQYSLIREHIYPWLVFFKKSKDITLRNTAQTALKQAGF